MTGAASGDEGLVTGSRCGLDEESEMDMTQSSMARYNIVFILLYSSYNTSCMTLEFIGNPHVLFD